MATRRSRIKAVANVPARRNRPLATDSVKNESLEATEGLEVDETPCLSGTLLIKPEATAPSQVINEKNGNLCNKADTVVDSPATPDRKSVIVTVEKDRKSVIVNRDDCISPVKSPLGSVNHVTDISNKNTITDEARILKTETLGRVSSHEDVTDCVADPPQSAPEKEHEKLQNLSKKEAAGHNQEHCDPVKEKNTSVDPLQESCGVTVSDSRTTQNVRVPLRGRRSKPTVNLTAASRKRPTNDVTSPSPCSPPPIRVPCKASEIEGDVPVPFQKFDKNSHAEGKVPNEQNKTGCDQTTSTEPLAVEAMECSSNGKVSSDSHAALESNLNGLSKNKDVPSGTLTEKGKTDAISSSPQKEIRRRQSSNAQKVAAARKSLKNKLSSDGPPLRASLTMFDLIFYNPSKNPMKHSEPVSKKPRSHLNSVSSLHEDRLNEEAVDDIDGDKEDTEEEAAMPVPQVKVGPDGSLILDEQSLVIETTAAKQSRAELEKSDIIIETGSSYGHYKKIVRSKDWSDHETKKFYRALNVVGTDFSLMKPYFRNRTRRELKLKFKKEERLNPNLVNKALADPLDFDISELEKECELEAEEEKRLEEEQREKAAEKSRDKELNTTEKVKKPKKRKMSRAMAEMEEVLGETRVQVPVSLGPPKKSRKTVAAQQDYEILAEGVNSGGKPNDGQGKETKKQAKKKKIKMSVAKRELEETNGDTGLKETVALEEPSENIPPSSSDVILKVSASSNEAYIPNGHSLSPDFVPESKRFVPTWDPVAVRVPSQAKVIDSSSLMQTSQPAVLNTPVRAPAPVMTDSTPPTIKIIEGQQPFSRTPTIMQSSKTMLATSCNRSPVIPLSASIRAIHGPSLTLASASTSLVTTPSSRVITTTPLSKMNTIQVTPQSVSNVSGFGVTTPVSRLLPSTPALPRMEPGSIIVLKTPLPQNPDQHVLQVYMVTNTPPPGTSQATSLPFSPSVSGMSILSGPTVQPVTPGASDDSDGEKVLTKL